MTHCEEETCRYVIEMNRTRIFGESVAQEERATCTSNKDHPEVRVRAVRLVFELQSERESQRAALSSIAAKIRSTSETLRTWVRQVECELGSSRTTDERGAGRFQTLERENRELRPAREILRKAPVYLAHAELAGQARASLRSAMRSSMNTGSRRPVRWYRSPRRHTTRARRGIWT